MRKRSKFKLDQAADQGVRAILYYRVSSRKQAAQGVSLDAQDALLRAEAERRGITDYILVAEVESAKTASGRPELQRCLDLLASGERNMIIVPKLDRLARSVPDTLAIAARAKAEGWDVVVVGGDLKIDTTDPHAELVLTILAAMSAFERRMIQQRTLEANAYRRSRGDEGLIPNAVEADVVKRYKLGTSMDKIAKELNDEAVPTAKGGRWYASTVKRVIDRAVEVAA